MRQLPPSAIRGAVLVALALLAFAPSAACAQADSAVYTGESLDKAPRFQNASVASRILAESYPTNMRRMGIGGMAQVSFIVGPNGKVEVASIQLVQASSPAIGDAAKRVVARIEFEPGQVKGQAVRTQVLLPIVYK